MVLLLNILPARLTAFLVSGCFLPVLKKIRAKKIKKSQFPKQLKGHLKQYLTVLESTFLGGKFPEFFFCIPYNGGQYGNDGTKHILW